MVFDCELDIVVGNCCPGDTGVVIFDDVLEYEGVARDVVPAPGVVEARLNEDEIAVPLGELVIAFPLVREIAENETVLVSALLVVEVDGCLLVPVFEPVAEAELVVPALLVEAAEVGCFVPETVVVAFVEVTNEEVDRLDSMFSVVFEDVLFDADVTIPPRFNKTALSQSSDAVPELDPV
ncbi:Hypothetical protein D9617_13g101090 [Elsinoe fawcettii]|nr:Hypothetical protein D9617_13g101090 [Elsinoe fawcettii]